MTRKEFLKATVCSTVLFTPRRFTPRTSLYALPRAASSARSLPLIRSIGVTENDDDLQQGGSTSAPATQPAKPRNFPAGTTKAVVDFISKASFDRMPQKVVDEAKRCLIDGFGVVLAGATVPGSAIVREHIKAAGAASGATILGREKIVATAAHAALANGASGHAMDYDDTQLSSTPDRVFGLLTHPTVPALAAALAVGERLNVSGRLFLEAFLIGFEVECKIAEAIKPDHYLQGFHSTGTIGTFGAVASAARLLKLPLPKSRTRLASPRACRAASA